jgi:hypothetical protein
LDHQRKTRLKLILTIGGIALLVGVGGESLRLFNSAAWRVESPVRASSVGWDDRALKRAVDEGRMVDAGPPPRPVLQPGTGSVFGVMYQDLLIEEWGPPFRVDPKGPVPAASMSGEVRPLRGPRPGPQDFVPVPKNSPDYIAPIRFMTDKQGRFRVDSVPAGRVLVSVDAGRVCIHTENCFTLIRAFRHQRVAYVREGQSTEVRFSDRFAPWHMTCQFVVGDGSRAQFLSGTGIGAQRKVLNETTERPALRVSLEARENEPVSFDAPQMLDLDDWRRIVLHDVHPGKYRVAVGFAPYPGLDALEFTAAQVRGHLDELLAATQYRGIVAEQDVEFKEGQAAVKISLGGGCITGVAQSHVIAVGKKSHTFRDDGWCDQRGHFCLRYLFPDEYVLVARDGRRGRWCRIGEVAVANNIKDVGIHTLSPGGTIRCQVPANASDDSPMSVKATDAEGFVIEESQRDHEPAQFAIRGLWPGKWTVSLRKCDHDVAVKTVVLRGIETIDCDLGGK